MSSSALRPLIVAGLPRCGTTLLSTFVAAQPSCTFLTDYLAAFTDALTFLHVGWSTPLGLTERRVALAKVRDQLLRFRHPVLVRPESFTTVAELHHAVLAELARPGDRVVGHKLVLDEREVAALLDETQCTVVVLYRDPRDAALSWFHRTGGGVEGYVERWRRMVTYVGTATSPRLFPIRYEQLVQHPHRALAPLFAALELPLDVERADLVFRGPGGALPFQSNTSFEPQRAAFEASAVGRWRAVTSSPVVRYTAAVTTHELERLGYPAGPPMRRREAIRWRAHRHAHSAVERADAWWKRGRAQVLARLAPPLRH